MCAGPRYDKWHYIAFNQAPILEAGLKFCAVLSGIILLVTILCLLAKYAETFSIYNYNIFQGCLVSKRATDEIINPRRKELERNALKDVLIEK